MQRFNRHPHETQRELWKQLIETGRHTEWGMIYDYRSLRQPEDYAKRMPLQNYEEVEALHRTYDVGEKDILWNGTISHYSLGTTTVVRVSTYRFPRQNLYQCHIKGTWDTMTLLYHNRPDARQFECKNAILWAEVWRLITRIQKRWLAICRPLRSQYAFCRAAVLFA
ncbi:MAG: GH3 auxin-responsive promoter family protein [Saprospiraceae bacterium]